MSSQMEKLSKRKETDCKDRYLHNILKEYSREEHPDQPIED